ncbi:SRPBCC domain-containing protein [Proteiniclasticum sp.]|uniref:SRPBCC domain-containing protein n=1 Tax=Proteiniclasticum sp. TaxID=2053595 RepID=UPI0028A1FDBA|nr:SRPBCC domain-containing protein [Proteiniclasticum sp.]
MTGEFRTGRTDTASKVIKATPEVLYEAYTDPMKLIEWLPPQGMSAQVDQYEPFEGGRFHITLTYESVNGSGKTTRDTDVMEGKFMELIPCLKIVQTGRFQSDDPSYSGEMTETVIFEEVDEGTRVTFIMDNVPEGISKADHDEGLKSTLENLAKFVEL